MPKARSRGLPIRMARGSRVELITEFGGSQSSARHTSGTVSMRRPPHRMGEIGTARGSPNCFDAGLFMAGVVRRELGMRRWCADLGCPVAAEPVDGETAMYE